MYAIFCFSLDDYLAHYRNPERRIVEFRVEAVELADVECYVQVTESLTQTELVFLCCILSGVSVQALARRLCINRRALDSYKERIACKLIDANILPDTTLREIRQELVKRRVCTDA